MELPRARVFKARRSFAVLLIMGVLLATQFVVSINSPKADTPSVLSVTSRDADSPLAQDILEKIAVKGRAPKTGYKRTQFGDGWAQVGNCDMRNIMLARAMREVKLSDDGCVVLSGTLDDPYTATTIVFTRGQTTSDRVQIDHVVALSDAWQKGAQLLSFEQRVQLANDPLNLLPVDGPANQKKGDSDAASWLPPNKNYRCQYVARQIAVKSKYGLWVTDAEKSAMKRVLNGCGEQKVPVET